MFKLLRIFRNGKTFVQKGSKTWLRPVTPVNAVASRGKANYTTIKGIFLFLIKLYVNYGGFPTSHLARSRLAACIYFKSRFAPHLTIRCLRSTTRQHGDALSKQRNLSCKTKALNNLWSHAEVSSAALSFSTQR